MLKRAGNLDALTGAYTAAVAARERASAALDQAEEAHEQVDASDADAWRAAEAAVAQARSEAARTARAEEDARQAARAAAIEAGRQIEENADALLAAAQRKVDDAEEALAAARAGQAEAEDAVRRAAQEANQLTEPFWTADEAQAARGRQAQRHELIAWYAHHRPRRDWPESMRAEIEAVVARRRAEAERRAQQHQPVERDSQIVRLG